MAEPTRVILKGALHTNTLVCECTVCDTSLQRGVRCLSGQSWEAQEEVGCRYPQWVDI